MVRPKRGVIRKSRSRGARMRLVLSIQKNCARMIEMLRTGSGSPILRSDTTEYRSGFAKQGEAPMRRPVRLAGGESPSGAGTSAMNRPIGATADQAPRFVISPLNLRLQWDVRLIVVGE